MMTCKDGKQVRRKISKKKKKEQIVISFGIIIIINLRYYYDCRKFEPIAQRTMIEIVANNESDICHYLQWRRLAARGREIFAAM